MVYTFRSDDNSKISLCENDTVKSVLQNITVLMATRKGTVPMYREFGLEMDYIDKPIEVAKTLMMAEMAEAIEVFEPRAKLLNIDFVSCLDTPGKVVTILEVDIEV